MFGKLANSLNSPKWGTSQSVDVPQEPGQDAQEGRSQGRDQTNKKNLSKEKTVGGCLMGDGNFKNPVRVAGV